MYVCVHRPALAKLQKLAASNAPADRVAFAELFFQYKVCLSPVCVRERVCVQRPCLVCAAQLEAVAGVFVPPSPVSSGIAFPLLQVVYESHACYEDGILFPAFEEYFPGLTEVVQVDHERDSGRMHDLSTLVAQLVPAVQPPPARVYAGPPLRCTRWMLLLLY